MHRPKWFHSLLAGTLILAMVASISGLLGAPGTTIRITSPTAGARVSGAIDVQASVKSTADVSYMLFGVDGDRPSSTNSTPYVFHLDTRTLTDGPHRIFVEAYDRYGMIASSEVITIHVKNGSASAVQASKPPATRVAARPEAESAARVAARRTTESAKTASAAATTPRSAAVSPATSVAGPRPEPVRTAAQPRAAASRPTVPALEAVARAPSEALTAAPAAPPRPVDRTRGHTVVMNGRAVEFDVAPRIKDGRMRVGFRAVFENTGGVVSWTSKTRTATSAQPGLTVEVSIGDRVAKVNGRDVDVGMSPVIKQDRTIVPLRFFAQATGSALNWNGATRVATVSTRPLAVAERSAED